MDRTETRQKTEQKIEGIPVSAGIVSGVAVVRGPSFDEPEVYAIQDGDIEKERNRFEQALVETRRQLTSLHKQVRSTIGADNASIFEAHVMVLEDHSMLKQVFDRVEQQKINIEAAFYTVLTEYMESLRQVGDPYLSERADDLQDVTRRVLRNLKPGGTKEAPTESKTDHPHILLAHDLSPSETASMDRGLILGFATETGAQTSHTAIIARSLNLPAVVGLHDLHTLVHTGDEVLLDGYEGVLILHPTPKTIAHYDRVQIEKEKLQKTLEEIVDQPAETTDGFKITLSCNIEFSHEVEQVVKMGGEGVGLYRTEYLYLNQGSMPSEEVLTEEYGRTARESLPHGIIVRTLDLGGDKLPGSLIQEEPNPFLGWRGIRVCLEEREMFTAQLRAILKASAAGKVAIMFPMVSCLEELLAAKQILEEAKQSLSAEGVPFDNEIKVGVMIEIPSAALIANTLAPEVDFFSIGTNDLVQYTIAVDRVNERVANLYAPHHPAVLRLIQLTTEAANQHGIWVGVCGEMASDILSTPLLVGLGVSELSVSASQVPFVKRAVRRLKKEDCEALVAELRTARSPEIVSERCREISLALYPELLA